MRYAQVWIPTKQRDQLINWRKTWDYYLLCEYIRQLEAKCKEQNGKQSKIVREYGSKIA